MTNGDRIREKLKGTILENIIDDERIADYYEQNFNDCDNCMIKGHCSEKLSCYSNVLNWLKLDSTIPHEYDDIHGMTENRKLERTT